MPNVRFPALLEIAQHHHLDLTGFLRLDDAEAQLGAAVSRFESWRDSGFAGEMDYMRRARELYTGLGHILPSARTVLLFLVPYAPNEAPVEDAPAEFGRIARYAWGRDYHRELKDKLWRFVEDVRSLAGPVKARVFSDAVPLLERSLAQRSGLGFIGKNTVLIRPGIGSFTFIAEVVWDLEIDGDVTEERYGAAAGSGCGTCSRCLTSCPTGAFDGPGRLDARKCISYLTIEKRTAFTAEEAEAIGGWLFGCDVCQEVCPFNHSGTRPEVPSEFAPENGAGKWLSLRSILVITEEEFRERFGDTALMRAGRAGLVRNACAVAANRGYTGAADELSFLAREDAAAIVRVEARRSLKRLFGQDFVEKSPVSMVI